MGIHYPSSDNDAEVCRSSMRYAIYFAPPPTSPLWLQGSRWLGRDTCTGEQLPQPSVRDLAPDSLAELTRVPARSGFHAPFVPPFRLKAPQTELGLLAALADFCVRQRPLALPSLIISQRDHSFCLRPDRHLSSLHVLASLCTREFDRFRAPLTPSELARFKAAQLSGQEKRNLEIWGYPYVFEQYRFHFPLTGRVVQPKQSEKVLAALIDIFGPLLAQPVTIDALCLFGEPEYGQPMRCLHRFPFSPQPSRLFDPLPPSPALVHCHEQ